MANTQKTFTTPSSKSTISILPDIKVSPKTLGPKDTAEPNGTKYGPHGHINIPDLTDIRPKEIPINTPKEVPASIPKEILEKIAPPSSKEKEAIEQAFKSNISVDVDNYLEYKKYMEAVKQIPDSKAKESATKYAQEKFFGEYDNPASVIREMEALDEQQVFDFIKVAKMEGRDIDYDVHMRVNDEGTVDKVEDPDIIRKESRDSVAKGDNPVREPSEISIERFNPYRYIDPQDFQNKIETKYGKDRFLDPHFDPDMGKPIAPQSSPSNISREIPSDIREMIEAHKETNAYGEVHTASTFNINAVTTEQPHEVSHKNAAAEIYKETNAYGKAYNTSSFDINASTTEQSHEVSYKNAETVYPGKIASESTPNSNNVSAQLAKIEAAMSSQSVPESPSADLEK